MKRHILAAAAAVTVAAAAGNPLEAFRSPQGKAKPGTWWHWMGTAVSREGIVRDLDWMADSGIGTIVAFAGPDVMAPAKVELEGGVAPGLVAWSAEWWSFMRFAVQEAVKRGLEIGIHNCPGYTHTGGPWTKPENAMRDLLFEHGGKKLGADGKPYGRKIVDKHGIARYPMKDGELVVSHVAKQSFNGPAQSKASGYECDKMSAEAVNAHWDHVLAEVKKHAGEHVGNGFNFLHADSCEAGTPSWTPRMREEFASRRGYDPLPYLPLLAGFEARGDKAKEFREDFELTVSELYRDVFFRITRERLHKEGLDFSCEPYGGPIRTAMCAPYVDRVGTEFWSGGCPWDGYELPAAGKWENLADRHFPECVPDGVFEAEAFTGWPGNSRWDETFFKLKPYADYAFARGVNRLMLHTTVHQPWGDGILPGMTFGCWGTHFGRTQTWAREAGAFMAYLARTQALLQWGEKAEELKWRGGDWGQAVRAKDGVTVRYIFNPSATNFTLAAKGLWLDPATGEEGAPPKVVVPGQSGFLVEGLGDEMEPVPPPREVQEICGKWRIEWKSAAPGTSPRTVETEEPYFDWTKSADEEVRHFSGTAKYSVEFDCADAEDIDALELGDLRGQCARVTVNGVRFGTLWAPPFRVRMKRGILKNKGNQLEIEYANVWANRLIGDEKHPRICGRKSSKCCGQEIGSYPLAYPGFLAEGKLPGGTKRRTFSMWNYFNEDSQPVPCGLAGPVRLVRTADARVW